MPWFSTSSFARAHLAADERGNVTLRVVDTLGEAIRRAQPMPIAVAATDFAESHEPRERAAGIRVLEQLLR